MRWPSFFAQFWRLIGPQRHHGVRRCPYMPCFDSSCEFWHPGKKRRRRYEQKLPISLDVAGRPDRAA